MAYYNGLKVAGMSVTGIISVDSEMSLDSDNPVQNKVVTRYVNDVAKRSLVFDTKEQLDAWLDIKYATPTYKEFASSETSASDLSYVISPSADLKTFTVQYEGAVGGAGNAYFTLCTIALSAGKYYFSFAPIQTYDGATNYRFRLTVNGTQTGWITEETEIELTYDQTVTITLGLYPTKNADTDDDNRVSFTATQRLMFKKYLREDGIGPENSVPGDMFFIKDTSIPGYWWDGEALQPLSSSGDLSNYYTKPEIDSLVGDIETALTDVIAEQESIISAMDSLIGGDIV